MDDIIVNVASAVAVGVAAGGTVIGLGKIVDKFTKPDPAKVAAIHDQFNTRIDEIDYTVASISNSNLPAPMVERLTRDLDEERAKLTRLLERYPLPA